MTPQNDFSHSHCWDSPDPPCGQRIKHFECCICERRNPEIESAPQNDEQDWKSKVKMKTFLDYVEELPVSSTQNYVQISEAQLYGMVHMLNDHAQALSDLTKEVRELRERVGKSEREDDEIILPEHDIKCDCRADMPDPILPSNPPTP